MRTRPITRDSATRGSQISTRAHTTHEQHNDGHTDDWLTDCDSVTHWALTEPPYSWKRPPLSSPAPPPTPQPSRQPKPIVLCRRRTTAMRTYRGNVPPIYRVRLFELLPLFSKLRKDFASSFQYSRLLLLLFFFFNFNLIWKSTLIRSLSSTFNSP